MPAALSYPLDLSSPEARVLEDAYSKEYNARAETFAETWNYYRGKMHKPLKTQEDGVDDNVIMPLVGNLADKVVSFLLGDGISFDAGGDNETNEEDEQLTALWDANRGSILQHAIALSGALTGHCAVRIEPRMGQVPRLVNLNPSNFTVFWAMDDVERVLWYRLQYQAGDDGKRIDIVRGAVEQGEGQNAKVNHDAEGWLEIVYTRTRGKHQWGREKVTPWPYLWPPIVDWPNLPVPFERYGQSDVEAAIALNDAVNRTVSEMSRILKHHASPKTVIIGADVDNIVQTQIGGLFAVPKEGAQVFNLEMQSDLQASLSFASLIERVLWQSGRMVDPQSLKDKVGALTNFGLRVLYIDAIRKTETKQQLYGEGWQEIGKRALEIMGATVPERITTRWPEALPSDDTAESEAVINEMGAGLIDKQTARDKLGYNHEEIEQRLADEKEAEDSFGALLGRKFSQGRERQTMLDRMMEAGFGPGGNGREGG